MSTPIRRTLEVLAALLVLTSCGLLGEKPLASVPPAWIQAERATYDVVAPKLETYLAADPELAADPIALLVWTDLLSDWNARIAAHEALIRPSASTPETAEVPR